MNYKPRPGIVQTKICGQHVLIPSRTAYADCREILCLPMLWAATFSLLRGEDPEEKILKAHKLLTKRSDEEIRTSVEKFCENLAGKGFLIRVEDEEKQ